MLRSGLPPRAVVVTRPSDYELLLYRHGTAAQARFFLESREQRLEPLGERHRVQQEALHAVLSAIPLDWRRARVSRPDLDRFLFEPEDVVVAVGQDGLVANVAKYLRGQPVIGVNPSKALYDGVLVKHAPARVGSLLLAAAATDAPCEERTMVEARTSDGARLVALNEIFLGHRRHQSARYTLSFQDRAERQSSSGLIVASGTGATGWASSLALGRDGCPELPTPWSRELVFLVREPWRSVSSGATLLHARYGPDEALNLRSEMNEGGVAFGDGIEEDHLELPWGATVTVRAADQALRLLAA
jgi:NAD kinase